MFMKLLQMKKLSNIVKPEEMGAEEWQRELRRQFATKELLSIVPNEQESVYGYFDVRNPKTKNSYKVVYRGLDSRWNYCSCMDFKTNQLGTCKHLEAVRQWLEAHHKKASVVNPPFSSLYVSYRSDRCICLRIGSSHWTEMTELAGEYFTPEGVALPSTLTHLPDFIAKAKEIDPDFRCYSDVIDYLAEIKDAQYRERYLSKVTDESLDKLLKTKLYEYQKEGVRFAFGKGKSVIADEMGLGKTIQAIATVELMRKAGLISSALVLCPASLKFQWKNEIERFTDSSAVIIEGAQNKRRSLYDSEAFYKIVSYHTVSNDIKDSLNVRAECLVMDEVQRIKNWNTQISRAVRRIQSDYAIVLSGTPLENKLEELYSVMEFVDQYCLGPYYKFIEMTTVKDDSGKVVGYKNLNYVGERLSNRLIRRRKSDVALQLPSRTDQNLLVPMTPQQQSLHDEFKTGVAQLVSKWRRNYFLTDKDRKRMLLLLSQMRMVCDSTYILDQETRYDTKVDEIMNIVRNVVESGDDKIVIFSQWERMTRLIAGELEKLNIGYSSLSGRIPSEARSKIIGRFQEDPECRVFLSTDTGSAGLNLQVASLVINVDLPWNPAVLEQRIGRIYRIGQERNVQIVNMISKDSFEERMLSTLNVKSALFDGILDGGEDTVALDDSKMGKIMESVAEYIASDGIASDVRNSVPEQPENCDVSSAGIGAVGVVSPAGTGKSGNAAETGKSGSEALSDNDDDENFDPEKLIGQGVSFLTNISEILQSPEKTSRLVNSLVHTDPQTGKSELRIPVPGKNAVSSIMALIAKFMAK